MTDSPEEGSTEPKEIRFGTDYYTDLETFFEDTKHEFSSVEDAIARTTAYEYGNRTNFRDVFDTEAFYNHRRWAEPGASVALYMRDLPCMATTDDGDRCSNSGRYVIYDEEYVLENEEPTKVVSFCGQHRPFTVKTASLGDGIGETPSGSTVIDTHNYGCQKHVSSGLDGIDAKGLSESFSSVKLSSKVNDRGYRCANRLYIRLHSFEQTTDLCKRHARIDWINTMRLDRFERAGSGE